MATHAHVDRVGEALARLILAAKEDGDFREHVMTVLRLPPFAREAIVTTAVREMTLRGESPDACAAFSLLSSDEVAAQARRALAAC